MHRCLRTATPAATCGARYSGSSGCCGWGRFAHFGKCLFSLNIKLQGIVTALVLGDPKLLLFYSVLLGTYPHITPVETLSVFLMCKDLMLYIIWLGPTLLWKK